MSDNDGFDDLLTNIGFGRWQYLLMLTTGLIASQLPPHLIGSPLLSAPMDFHCSPEPPENLQESISVVRSLTNDTYFNNTCLTLSGGTTERVAEGESGNVTGWYLTSLPSCPYIEYDTSIFTTTIISQWHLVCEQANLVPLFQMMYNIGGLVGSTLGGHLGDKFGRKKAIIIGATLNIIGVVLMAVVPVYSIVLAMRLLVGITNNILLIPAWSLALECSPSQYRSLVGMLLGLPYSVGVVVFGGISYLVRSWQHLILVSSAPILIILPLAIYIDESPSWLIQQGRTEEVTKVLLKAVSKNKVDLPTPLAAKVHELIEAAASSNSHYKRANSTSFENSLRELKRYFSSAAMRIIFLATTVLWFLQPCLYLSVAINANNFTSTDPFLYVALTGVMDGSAILLSTPLATRFGRKIMIFCGMLFGAVLFLLDLFISVEYYWAKWILVMVGFLLVGASYQVNYVYAPELFPTAVRTRCFAYVNVIGQIGYICAPLVTNILAKYTWWAAGVSFGCAGIIGSLMIPFLPETRNKPLPETLQDVEDRRSKAMSIKKEGKINPGFSEEKTV